MLLLLLYHFKDFLCNSSIVIIRDRSLFIPWGSVVTENPKGGIAEKFGRIQRGTTQICLENGDMGGNRESHQMLLGGVTSMK